MECREGRVIRNEDEEEDGVVWQICKVTQFALLYPG